MSQEVMKMVYYAYLHSLCPMKLYSVETLQRALKSSKCKRGQVVLSQDARIEILADIYLKLKNITISLTTYTLNPIICGRQQKHIQFKFLHPLT
jgi:hypothetical protein